MNITNEVNDRLVRNHQDLWTVYIDLRSLTQDPAYQALMKRFSVILTELSSLIAYTAGDQRLEGVKDQIAKFGATVLPGLADYLDEGADYRLRRVVNDFGNTLQIGYSADLFIEQ